MKTWSRSLVLGSCLVMLDIALAAPAFADSSAAPAESHDGTSGATSVTNAAAPAKTAKRATPNAREHAPSDAAAKANALDGIDDAAVAASARANAEPNIPLKDKRAGKPVKLAATDITRIGTAHGDGQVGAGDARAVATPTTTAETTVVGGLPHRTHGAAASAGKEAASAVESAMPKLVACLPAGDVPSDALVLVRATVGAGGAVGATSVGSFSQVSSTVAACLASAMASASFDSRRTRSDLVAVRLDVAEIAKHRAQTVASK